MEWGERQGRFIERWESEGVDAVRLSLSADTWSHEVRKWAIAWIASKDQEARRASEASQSEQIEIARLASAAAIRAATAAERAASAAEVQAAAAQRANTIARAALIVAAISMAISIIAPLAEHLLFPLPAGVSAPVSPPKRAPPPAAPHEVSAASPKRS